MNRITHYQWRSVRAMNVNILIHSMYRPSQALSILCCTLEVLGCLIQRADGGMPKNKQCKQHVYNRFLATSTFRTFIQL